MGRTHFRGHAKPHARQCRVCGCTDSDCSGCVARTGAPCHWVRNDLCSACVPAESPRPAQQTAEPKILGVRDLFDFGQCLTLSAFIEQLQLFAEPREPDGAEKLLEALIAMARLARQTEEACRLNPRFAAKYTAQHNEIIHKEARAFRDKVWGFEICSDCHRASFYGHDGYPFICSICQKTKGEGKAS